MQAPTTPVKRSNRGFGIGVMLLSSLVFAAIYGAIIYLVTFYFLDPSVDDGTQGVLQALGTPVFWVPVVVYLVACILWVLIVNRAGGWLHVLFGLIVGVLAYASVVAVLSVTASLAESRPEDFADFVFRSLIDSRALLAFIVARELTIWFGAWIGRRGRDCASSTPAPRPMTTRWRLTERPLTGRVRPSRGETCRRACPVKGSTPHATEAHTCAILGRR